MSYTTCKICFLLYKNMKEAHLAWPKIKFSANVMEFHHLHILAVCASQHITYNLSPRHCSEREKQGGRGTSAGWSPGKLDPPAGLGTVVGC